MVMGLEKYVPKQYEQTPISQITLGIIKYIFLQYLER